MRHYIERCLVCSTVISQCRCPSKDKEARLGICDKCKDKQPVKPTDHAALVQRLKELGAELPIDYAICSEAADAIEALTRERDDLKIARQAAVLAADDIAKQAEQAESALAQARQERDEALKERTVAQFQRNALVELSGQKGNAAFGTLFVRMADALYDKRQAEAESARLTREKEILDSQVAYIVSCQDDKAKNPGDELLDMRKALQQAESLLAQARQENEADRQQLHDQNELLMRERDTAREALRMVEWYQSGTMLDALCPWCNGDTLEGHAATCARQAALGEGPR